MSHAVLVVGAVAVDEVVGFQIQENAGDAANDLLTTTSSGNVTVTIAAYSDPDDALDQFGARGTFSGSGAIVRLVSGLNVVIKAADTVTASVDHGFVRFLSGATPPAPTGQAALGWLGLEGERECDGGCSQRCHGSTVGSR